MGLSGTARLAAVFWLLNCVATAFSLGYVRGTLIVWTDAAQTAANLAANESLFRAAIASYLLSQVFLLFFGLTAFRLFREVSRTWSTILLASIITTAAISVANALNNIAAVVIAGKPDFLGAFSPDQLTSLMMLFLRINNHGQGVLEIFWLPYMFALGLLIVLSEFVPRVFGFIIMIAAFGFPIYTFSKLLSPQSLPSVFISIVGLIAALGTIPTIGWLLIKGVKCPAKGVTVIEGVSSSLYERRHTTEK